MCRSNLILLTGALLLAISGGVWGQQQNAAERTPVPVEFSNLMDKQAVAGGGALNGLLPMQVIYTGPPDPAGPPYPSNIFNLGGDHQTDALANLGDAFFQEVPANTANLLVSFNGDPGVNAVWYETPGGATGVQWTHQDLSNVAGGPDPALDDVDGLEVWGPEPGWDANYYSETQEPFGFSVLHAFAFPGGYVPWPAILAAVQSLGWVGDSLEVDLDGLMVWDMYDSETWGPGDTIIFSIRAAGNWDGGEIVVLPFGGPATFLNHGGHVWNTAFPVGATFNVGTEDVDGIEGDYGEVQEEIPTLTEWGMIIFCALLFGWMAWVIVRRRRKVTVGI